MCPSPVLWQVQQSGDVLFTSPILSGLDLADRCDEFRQHAGRDIVEDPARYLVDDVLKSREVW